MTDAVASDEAAAAVAQTDPVEPAADDAWGNPPRAAPGAVAAPVLSVEGFESPLDWLLEMARARKLDLARLSILALIEAFAGAMQMAFRRGQGDAPVSLSRWGNWLVTAASLTELRSRLLLPAYDPGARATRGQAETLRRQLLSRARIAAAADWLARRPQLGRDVHARGVPEAGSVRTHRSGDITELLRACLVALRLDEQQAEAYRLPPPTRWPIADAIARAAAAGRAAGRQPAERLSAADPRERSNSAPPPGGAGQHTHRRADARSRWTAEPGPGRHVAADPAQAQRW